ncbi:hypothetical protein [Nonomuraea sp. NPDC023979]|uniref:hypothetical protein n=1 Tax=Nonomuraea sp. NPDC023979 TaxID=3154796 RepID=UPI0033CC2720
MTAEHQDPPAQTGPALEALQQEIERIRQIADPDLRGREVGRLQSYLQEAVTDLSGIRRGAIDDLKAQGVIPAEMARSWGISRARLSTLAGHGPGPERGLFVSTPRPGATLTIATVRRRAARSQPAAPMLARDAVAKIDRLLSGMGMTTAKEVITATGWLDLNRDVAVLASPRASPLIAQAVTADPAIKWRRDGDGRWILVDVTSGEEFRSGFDDEPHSASASRVCYAHLGRIRRPDGAGGWLYVGGMHEPGTAGAVDFLVGHVELLWEKTRRHQWSTIVRVETSTDGAAILSAELAVPIHIYGRR